MEKNENIFFRHRILANIRYIIQLIDTLIIFKKCYRNYFQVFLHFLNQLENESIELKNGEKFFNVSSQAAFTTAVLFSKKKFNVKIKEDVVEFKHEDNQKEKIIKIFGGVNNGDVFHIFLKNEYGIIPFKNKTILDIGANIGDSSIYFAINGAEKIVGIEPFFNNFDLSQKNIAENNLSEKIQIIQAGCGDKIEWVEINPNFDGNVYNIMKNQNNGRKVLSLTLHEMINKFKIPKNSILKMDCEGCEYKSIISAENETLKYFEHIIIEYHHGYKDLIKKLKEADFDVVLGKPTSTGFIGKYLKQIKCIVKKNTSKKIMFENNGYVGIIQASRIK